MDNTANPPSQTPPTVLETPTVTESPLAAISESTPPPPPVKKKRSIAKIIFIILGSLFLLLLILAGAAFYYLQSQGLTPDKLSPQPKAPQTTIAPRNTTTNTYKNQNYKFSLPLEKELQVKESPYGFGVTSVEMRSPETPAEYGPDFQMLVFPKVLGAAIGQDFNKSYDSPEGTAQEIKDPSGASVQFTKVRNRTIKALRAFEFASRSLPADPEVESEIGVYIEMGTDVLIVTTGESNRAQLEAMLTDFKYPL